MFPTLRLRVTDQFRTNSASSSKGVFGLGSPKCYLFTTSPRLICRFAARVACRPFLTSKRWHVSSIRLGT